MIKKNKTHFQDACVKRLSFIIATKNRAKFLERTLQNAKKFKKANDEIIIIDGDSTDSTKQVIERNKSIIDIYISEPDLSPAHAVNKGILLSQGEYILQLTDDDTFYEDAIEQAISVLQNSSEVDMLVCGGEKLAGKKVKVINLPEGVNYGQNIEDPFKYGASGVGFIYRKRIFAQTGLLPTSITADVEFILKAIQTKANVRFCRIKLYTHPVNERSTVVRKNKEYMKDYYRLIKEYGGSNLYFKYRLKNFLKQRDKVVYQTFESIPLLKKIIQPYLFTKKIIVKSKMNKPQKTPKSYNWDEGFS